MAVSTAHGSKTVIKIGSNVVGGVNTSAFTAGRDSHDITVYGADAHEFYAGLANNSFTMSGVYDVTATTGAVTILKPMATDTTPTAVAIIRYPEGNVATKPTESFSAILTNYTETSPVADMVTWQADFQISGAVTPGTVSE